MQFEHIQNKYTNARNQETLKKVTIYTDGACSGTVFFLDAFVENALAEV